MITSGTGLDVSLLASGGLGQCVFDTTVSASAASILSTSSSSKITNNPVIDIFLWTYGASYILDKAREMNFTCVVTPAQINVSLDKKLLDSAKEAGIGVAFDIRQVAENWINPEWEIEFTQWLNSIKEHASLKYLLVYPDINRDSKYLITASRYSMILNLQALSLEQHINKIAPSIKTLTSHSGSIVVSNDPFARSKYLGKMDVEGIAAYSNWRGNSNRAIVTEDSCISLIQGYAALYSSVAENTSLCLWLQGFESTKFENTSPSYDQWNTLWNAAQSASQRFNRIGFMGWSLAGKNVSGIGNSQLLQREIALFNARARGIPFISPSRSTIKTNSSFTFSSSSANPVWALNNAPSGTSISQNGTVLTGSFGGTCHARIYAKDTILPTGQPLPDNYLSQAILYIDAES